MQMYKDIIGNVLSDILKVQRTPKETS